MKRQLEIQKIEIESIEITSSNIKKRLEKLEDKKSTVATSPPEDAPDALYNKAESYYSQGKYVDAILTYQSFIDSQPNHKRVADAYLKQGLSLVKTGRKDAAKFFFRTLIDKFPQSTEAKRAKKELEKLEKNRDK